MSFSFLPKYLNHRMPLLAAIIWLSVSAAWAPAASARLLILEEHRNHYKLIDYLEFLEDPAGGLTIDEVAAEKNQWRFAPRSGQKRHFGFSNSVFWIRLRVENHSAQNRWLIVAHLYDQQVIDQIDLYMRGPDGDFRRYRGGEAVSRAESMVPDFNVPAFTFDLPNNQRQTLYFRIQDEALILLMMELYPASRSVLNAEMLLGIVVLGAYSLLFLHTLLLYGALRDPVFLYFALFILGIPLTVLQGFSSIFAPDLPLWWANRLRHLPAFYYSIVGLILLKNFYQIDGRTAAINWWVRGLMLACILISTGFFLLPYSWSLQARAWLFMINMLAALVISAEYQRKGFTAGRYFLVAACVNFLIVFSKNISNSGIFLLPCIYEFRQWYATTAFISLLFYSLALIDRHNILSQQMLAAQQKAVQSMRKAEQAKDEFLANTSHELRTPLAGIIGLAEDLVAQCKSTANTVWQSQLNIIVHSARRLATLISDILDATRIRQGKVNLAVAPVDFAPVLKLVTALCRPLADQKKISIQTDLPNKLPPIQADENRLQQILINLIKNGISFTPEGSIEITARVEKEYLRVAVRDTGIGIPEDQHEAIFDRFTQLDGGMERVQGGAGLGLAITRQLVELQGGRISVESSPGKGACFSFTLPLAPEGHHAPFQSQAVAASSSASQIVPSPAAISDPSLTGSLGKKGPRILIVDDEEISRHVLNTHLSSADYKVTSAGDAFEAEALLKTNTFDLVVLDIMMPRKNGFLFCRDIRHRFNPTELPVIMLTARSRVEDLAEGFDCGANDYLTKPVNRIELLARVKTSLKLKHIADLLRENNELKEEIFRRKRAEQQLNTANKQLVGLLNLWEAALLLVDDRHQILYFNQCAEDLFGYQPHEIVNRPLSLIFKSQAYLIRHGNTAAEPVRMENEAFSSRRHRITANTAENRTVAIEVIVTPIMVNSSVVYALICRRISDEEEMTIPSDQETLDILARHHQKIQAMQGTFDTALTFLQQEGQQLNTELHQIDHSMAAEFEAMSEKELDLHYREALVELMTHSLYCWQKSTGEDKIALAEKSGIWRIYLDGSTYKTRTLDKYLNPAKLPKNPRDKEVMNTAEFVLQNTPETLPMHQMLSASLDRFKVIMNVKNIRGKRRVKSSGINGKNTVSLT